VLTIGGIEPRKGTVDLVDAYSKLHQRIPNLSLVIAGSEMLFDYRDYRTAFERRCTDLGVEPVILGPSRTQSSRAVSRPAACSPSRRPRNGSGWRAMEALAAGRPVVVRDLPAMREVFGGTVSFGRDAPSFAAALSDPGNPEKGRNLARSDNVGGRPAGTPNLDDKSTFGR
jgi:glycosyltransferase involved in cell wall biosynthesis